MKSLLMIFTALTFAHSAIAMHHENTATGEGAFTTLMVKADDPSAYIDLLKSDDGAFKATGTVAAGYCLTRTGHDHQGQMFVWSAFSSLSDALASSAKYDPMDSPNAGFSSVREIKYAVTWKPLIPFKLAPGFERMIRVVVPQSDREAFVSNMVKAQEGLYDAGYKMNLGVFESIGGGKVEANILHVRAIAPTPSDFGRVLDDFYSGSVDMGGNYWLAAFALVEEIESDYMQECEQVYTIE